MKEISNFFCLKIQWTWILVMITFIRQTLSQNIPFSQNYDAQRSGQWSTNYNSSSTQYQNNYGGSNGPNSNRGGSSTEFQGKDFRNYPDQKVNWLSPNPFAEMGNNKNTVVGNKGTIDRDGNFRDSTGKIILPVANYSSNRYPTQSAPTNPFVVNTGQNQPSWSPDSSRQNQQSQGAGNTANLGDPFAFNSQRDGNRVADKYGRDQSVQSNTVPIDGFGRRDEDSGGIRSENVENSFRTVQSNDQGSGPGATPRTNLIGWPEVGPKSSFPGSSIDGKRYPNGSFIPYPQTGQTSNFQNPLDNWTRSNSGGQQQQYHGAYPGLTSNTGIYYDNSGRPIPPPPPFLNYPGRGNFDPGYPNVNVWNEFWTTTTYRPTALGVLGRWRPELQGMQRPEDINQVPQSVYVMTTYGRVQGFKSKLYDGPWVPQPARPGITSVDKVKAWVTSFVGIPYARAPVNEGRFRPPRSHPGWQLHQAVEIPPACPQPSRFFGFQAGIIQLDEDCLFLNVYSPGLSSVVTYVYKNLTKLCDKTDVGSGVEGSPFPVIFYIHDGDFVSGASHQFPPHQLVAWYKLVVVTVNFRLGSLGFLSTGDEYSPGNYGMMDLSMALKWVHENIHSFNGDPDRVTLVGLGSGAAAAGLLMLSPRTKHIVKNVVAMEGALTADWAAIIDQYRVQNTTQLYSYKMGCWQDFETTSWKMVQCLRSRSWQELANLELDPDVGTFPWSPVVDRTFRVPKDDHLNEWSEEDWRFLPDTPQNMLRTGNYPFIKYMTGFSRQSAADLLYQNKSIAPNYQVTREWVKKYNYTLNPEGVFNAIRYAYTYWPDPKNTTHMREEYIDFLSDALYRAPIDETVKLLLARGIQVHMYYLNYTLEALRLPFWREVPRGLEYYMLSGAPFMDPEYYPERVRVDRYAWSEGDRNMSNFLMTAVANMAYYGSPTPREVLGIYWERCTPADLKYLALNGTNNSTMQRNYRQREVTFWSEYMPSVVGHLVATYAPTTEFWWEPNEPLQIAFWSVSGVCLVLIVGIVICCLLWRQEKRQKDRIYDDLGLGREPLRLGSLAGDEISEYAETVKTMDSMDSGKYSQHPNPQRYPQSLPLRHPHPDHRFVQTYSTLSTIQNTSNLRDNKDKFPVPMKKVAMNRSGRETPQTTV